MIYEAGVEWESPFKEILGCNQLVVLVYSGKNEVASAGSKLTYLLPLYQHTNLHYQQYVRINGHCPWNCRLQQV